MKVQKLMKAQGEYAKVGEDFRDEDMLTIKDSGMIVSGDYGDRHVFKVETSNGDKNLTFNQTSMNNVIDAYGNNTESWEGQKVRAYIVKQMVGDSLKKVVYLTGENYKMTDDGKFIKIERTSDGSEMPTI